jgi:biofilm PGA synthesis N-glycosyltransferase PgaC
MEMDYIIITPVRDEEKLIENTVLCLINQTIKPSEWIIVNDGSTDRTGAIIDHYAEKLPWIRTVHRRNRGFRKSGGGVIEAFYDGYSEISADDWDFIVKLDGDLIFGVRYFERCFAEFLKDPNLGIGGGTVFNLVDGSVVSESNPAFHVRGATKIYRRAFWENSGGLLTAPGWDTIDEIKANMLNWRTRTFPHVHIFQQKVTGSADGIWKNAFKNGKGSYASGYHPLYMILKCIKRFLNAPYGLESLGLMAGFLCGHLRKLPRIQEKELIAYLRQQQLKRLKRQESIWK